MQMKFVALLTGLIWHPSHFFAWMRDHGVRRGHFGLEFKGGRDVLRRIHERILPSRGTRIRIADLGERFPQTRITADAYDMDTTEESTGLTIKDIYDEMAREIAKLEASERKDKGANILTQQLRARQRVELLKVPTFVELANDALEEGMSVVIIMNYDASIQAMTERLNTFNTITGADTDDYRQRLIDKFNADTERLIVMNIKAGGVGVSLQGRQTSPTRYVLISPSYSGIDMKQAIGRFPRAFGAFSIIKIVFAAGTIEEHVYEKSHGKIQRIDLLNDAEISTMFHGL
jgi:hypothetical protein